MTEIPKLLPFERYLRSDFGKNDKTLERLVQEGRLSADILLRLLSVGEWQPDPQYPDTFTPLHYSLLADAMWHADNPTEARGDTNIIIQGALPDVIVDLVGNKSELYEQLPTLYWSKRQLEEVIRLRRVSEGKTITEGILDSWYTADELEEHRCRGLAQPIWRTLVTRLRPDIIKHPGWFYPNKHFGYGVVYNLSERTIKRLAISRARIKDDALCELYDEIESTGMRGIGPVGRRDLGAMLAPEHADIMMSLAGEAGLHAAELELEDEPSDGL